MYSSCSLFRLLLRVLNQMIFLTPKPNFIPPAPQHRPYIGAIFGPIMLVWFAVIAVLGVVGIARGPAILAALSPLPAIR